MPVLQALNMFDAVLQLIARRMASSRPTQNCMRLTHLTTVSKAPFIQQSGSLRSLVLASTNLYKDNHWWVFIAKHLMLSNETLPNQFIDVVAETLQEPL